MYKKKSIDEKREEIESLITNAQENIEKIFDTPKDLKEYLFFMSKFYDYSFNNTTLINLQFPNAVAVGSYSFWKQNGFSVNKGEKGIKILVPTKLGDRFELDGKIKLVSKATKEEKEMIKNKKINILEGRIVFKQGYTFDISQTNAKSSDLPKLFPNKWLDGNLTNYEILCKGIENIAKKNEIEIINPKFELGSIKGVSYTESKKIATNKRNSQIQNFKTLLHELTHSKLHSFDKNTQYNKNEKEFQAELTAYTVCSYFNIDTSEYSLRYIKAWTKNAELKDKEKLLREVRDTSHEFITIIEDTLKKEMEINKMDYKNNTKKILDTIDESNLKSLYEKSALFDGGRWNELKAIESVLNRGRSKYNRIDIEDMYPLEANTGKFEDMEANELIEYYEKGKFGDIISSEEFGIYEKVTYGGDYKNKESYKNFRVEVMKEALLRNLMHEDPYIKPIKEYYSAIEKESTSDIEKLRLNNEFKDEFDISYKEYMKIAKEKENIKDLINKEINEMGVDSMSKEINEKDIRKMIREHDEWLNTKGEKGKRLDLEGKKLNGIRFLNLDLRNSNFKNADISDCIFYADLKNADFSDTKINENTKFTGSKNLNFAKFDGKTLDIIETQIKEESDKHKLGMKNLKLKNNKEMKLER